ncbi:MAG: CRISPR-associated endoribonuclease Cas6 [Bacteroidia bacterium]|nr:CRISPR-associated endoribonuclease Cas6 [Bacteroidia bacterium]NNC86805.1 CRISPR-associated endoribonuclease Cas6 [Bacteroidia bacterium]NNM16427.1 CRISPR-associated endoribonuclease Cas6 [Bacteroidia bacterium]
MRVKISFHRDHSSVNSLPLHHQKLLADALSDVANKIKGEEVKEFNFSSLKGTSRIQNGFMRFLSTKVTLVISSSNEELVNKIVDEIFSQGKLEIGKIRLFPKATEVISDPEFGTQMRYLCISPLVLVDPRKDSEKSQEMYNPGSQEFSDLLYNQVMENMEGSGIDEAKLDTYVEFEATPDMHYVQKINETGKKFARFYKCTEGHPMLGYLLPFTLHAHPEVHKYIWEHGMGALNQEGYGMLDIVNENGNR